MSFIVHFSIFFLNSETVFNFQFLSVDMEFLYIGKNQNSPLESLDLFFFSSYIFVIFPRKLRRVAQNFRLITTFPYLAHCFYILRYRFACVMSCHIEDKQNASGSKIELMKKPALARIMNNSPI